MPQFPLYELLMMNLPEKDLTVIERKKLLETIPRLEQDAHDLLYALIKCFYLEHVGDLAFPYEGQMQKDRIAFDLKKFPVKLRRLLYSFIVAHSKKLEEDQVIYKTPM